MEPNNNIHSLNISTVRPSLTTLDIAPLKGLIQEKMFAGVSALTNTGTDSSISE